MKNFSEYGAVRWRVSTQKWTGKPTCDCRCLSITLVRLAMYVINVPTKRVRVTTVAEEKQWVVHILCVCVSVALVLQHAKRMLRIILSYVACLALPYFSTWSHKRHDFRQKLLNIKCVSWFSIQLLS